MVKIFLISLLFTISGWAGSLDLAKIKDINGQALSLKTSSDQVFLYFWAYWCPDCETKFKTFFPKYKDSIAASVITINTDSKENKVRGFIEKNKINLPVVMDTEKIFRKWAAVNAVPGWAVLQKEANGEYKLLSSQNGFDEDQVKKVLNLK